MAMLALPVTATALAPSLTPVPASTPVLHFPFA